MYDISLSLLLTMEYPSTSVFFQAQAENIRSDQQYIPEGGGVTILSLTVGQTASYILKKMIKSSRQAVLIGFFHVFLL